jgi:hypothetical protein
MRYIFFLLAVLLGVLAFLSESRGSAVSDSLGDELPTIDAAAERNNCHGEFRLIFYAIRMAEHGRAGREFGILHPKADTLDRQAGWCAATILKNHRRWLDAGRPGEFLEFLAGRYCPVGAANDPDGLNVHWLGNVRHWYRRFGGTEFLPAK